MQMVQVGKLMGGKGILQFPRPFVIANRPRGTLFYDSIGNQFRRETALAVAPDGFNNYMKTYFDPTTAGGLQDMSTDGCALLKSTEDAAGGSTWLIDDVTDPDYADWTRSPDRWDTVYDAMTTAANTSDYAMIVSGTNDASVDSGITKEKYKQGAAKLKYFIQNGDKNFPNIQCGFLTPIHRSDFADSEDDLYQIVREAQNELCVEDTWFKRLPDTYDLDLADTAHFTNPEYQTRYGFRMAKAIAYYFGKIPVTGVFGPQVTAATFYGGHMDLTVAQDAGTDFDTIPSGAENTLGIRLGSSDFKPSSVERVDASTLRAHFDDKPLSLDAIEKVMIAHGTMKELSQTSAEVIKDNHATDPRPLRSGVVVPTIAHPLFNGSDLNVHMMAKTGTKTYASGTDTSNIADRCGIDWASASGDEPYYDDTAFGGKGALVSADGNRFMQSQDNSWTVSNTGWGGIVFEVPATPSSNKYLLTFEGGTQVAFYMNGSGQLYFQQNQANGVELLSGLQDLRSTKNALIWNFRSLDAVDFYLNDNDVITINPRDSLIAWNRITLFNRSSAETGGHTGMKVAEVFHRNTAHDPDNDPSIASLIAFYQSYYGTQ